MSQVLIASLVEQLFGDNDGLKEKILNRCQGFIADSSHSTAERGGQEEDAEADTPHTHFHRGHGMRQTAPPGVSRKPDPTVDSNEEIAQKGRHSSLSSGCNVSLSEEALQECCSPDSAASKMPVIRRALSPIDGHASTDPGEVETTVYRSYRRRSRTATQTRSPKATPLAAVCDEIIIQKHTSDLAAGSNSTVPSPPIPPSKIPDFKLHLTTQEALALVSKQSDINKHTEQSAGNGSALQTTRLNTSKDNKSVSLNKCSSAEDKTIRSCQNKMQPALVNPTKRDHQPGTAQGAHLNINSKNASDSERLSISDKTLDGRTADSKQRIQSRNKTQESSKIKQPISMNRSLMDTNTHTAQMDTSNKMAESVDHGKSKPSGIKSTKQKRQLPAIPQNVQPVLIPDRTKTPTVRKDDNVSNKQQDSQVGTRQNSREHSKSGKMNVNTNNTQQNQSRNQPKTIPQDNCQNQNSVLGAKNPALSDKPVYVQKVTTHPTKSIAANITHLPTPQTKTDSRGSNSTVIVSVTGKVGAPLVKTQQPFQRTSSNKSTIMDSGSSSGPCVTPQPSGTKTLQSVPFTKTKAGALPQSKHSKSLIQSKAGDSGVKPVNKPVVNVSDTAASMIKHARSQKSTKDNTKPGSASGSELSATKQSNPPETKSPSADENKRVCSNDSNKQQTLKTEKCSIPNDLKFHHMRGENTSNTPLSPEGTHSKSQTTEEKSSNSPHAQICRPKQQTKETVKEYANEPVKLKPRVYSKTSDQVNPTKSGPSLQPSSVQITTSNSQHSDNAHLDSSTPKESTPKNIPGKSHSKTAGSSERYSATPKPSLAQIQNTDLSKPIHIKATTSGQQVNAKQALPAQEQSNAIKTDANINTLDVSVHNKTDYGHTVIVSQEVKIQNKEDKNTNIFPVKVKKQTITPNSPNVKETQKEKDFLDMSLTNLDEDFAKPLASSTLQRKSKAKNTLESSNTLDLSEPQLNRENEKRNIINEKKMPPMTRGDDMRESIRQKRLQYFNSQAANQTTANTVAFCTGGEPGTCQATALLPQQNGASMRTKGEIDSHINIHKGTLPSNSSGTKECTVLDANENVPKQMSKHVGNAASCEQKNKYRTVVKSATSGAVSKPEITTTHQPSINKQKTNITHQRSVNKGETKRTQETLVNGGNLHHSDRNIHKNVLNETNEFENTITAHIDSTIVLPDDESLLETTLTVSHGNADTGPPYSSLSEENMADISSISRNSILHYQLTIQDNCNGININVNRTSERPVLDLMDVSQDGIQRLQLHDNSFVNESERSYAISPDISLTASTETLASTTHAGDDWHVSYLPDNTTVLVNSDAFLQEDSISDITCDTTYLMDADAWGTFDEEPDHNTTQGTCDPVADPLHLNCRLRHIPLEGQSNHVVSTAENLIVRNTPLRSSRGGYPWQRYQDLHRSRSNIFVPPWRSGTEQNGQGSENTESLNGQRLQNTQEPTNVRASSVLRTLVRPGSRRHLSTDSLATTVESSSVAPSVVQSNITPVTSASVNLPYMGASAFDNTLDATLNSTSSTLSAASSDSEQRSQSRPVSNINELRAQNVSTSNTSTLTTSQSSVIPSVPMATTVTTSSMSSQPIHSHSFGYTNAIIEEVHSDSFDQPQTSTDTTNKGKGKRNVSKGKSITQKCMDRRSAERPVAFVMPRKRTVATSSSLSTAVSNHASQSQTRTNPLPSTATSISSTPSLHISSTVSIGSTYSAFTPRSFPYRSQTYSHTRPASAIPSTESISPLPTASTFNTRSMTPTANSTMDLLTRPAFDRFSRESLLSNDDSVSTTSNSTLDMIRSVNRRIPSLSRDDIQLESGSDFVFVDEDLTDVSSRQTFRRSGLASTIQPSMRRARSITTAGRRNDDEPNYTDSLGHARSLEETVAGLRDDIVRVPGALILSIRRNRLVVYLSQDRPNVEGVIRFMQQHGISRADYEVEILPWGPNSSRPIPQSLQTVSS